MGEPIKYLGYDTLKAVVNNLVGESETKEDAATESEAEPLDLSYLAEPYKAIAGDK